MAETPRDPFVVCFVPGVTPGKWERIWRERMPRQTLELRPAPQPEALAALARGDAAMAFLRDVEGGEHAGVELHVIPLYEETAVVVAPKEHVISVVDAVTEAELEAETVQPGEDADTLALVAAGVGVARMPHSVWRAHSRRDLIARPVADAAPTRVGLAWPVPPQGVESDPRIETLIGIVRGRTARSSRG